MKSVESLRSRMHVGRYLLRSFISPLTTPASSQSIRIRFSGHLMDMDGTAFVVS